MGKKVNIRLAAELTGLSQHEIRRGALSGRYPSMRIGGERGRLIFDIEILNEHIIKIMLNNLKQEEQESYGSLRKVK